MKTFILAGYQRSLAHHVKAALEKNKTQLGGWAFELFPGDNHHESSISSKQADVLFQKADKHDGAHILGISGKRHPQRRLVEEKVTPHFRFRWLDEWCLGSIGGGDSGLFIDALIAALHEEDIWLETIKPIHHSSPLILPEIFAAKKSVANIWRLSESYNNTGHFAAAVEQIKRFTREHRRRADGFSDTPWVDEKSRIWSDGGPQHGVPDFPRGWKYSYRLSDGFHYDVSPSKNSQAEFVDVRGRAHSFSKGYLNVTAHGDVRGT